MFPRTLDCNAEQIHVYDLLSGVPTVDQLAPCRRRAARWQRRLLGSRGWCIGFRPYWKRCVNCLI